MKFLIGLVGRKRSGKDTIAKFVTEMMEEFTIMSFADPLKQACKHAYYLRDSQLEDTKDVVDVIWGMTPRDMMKSLGGKYFRNEDPGHWVKVMELRMAGIDHVIISDVRFENEAQFIRDNGGYLIHVSRDMESNNDDHVTEKTTDEIRCDYSINNNGSLVDLRVQLTGLLQNMM